MFTLCLYTDSALIHSVSFQQQTFPSSPNGFHRISRYFQPPKSVQEQIGFEHLSRSSVMTVQNCLLIFFTNSLIILILFDFHCIILRADRQTFGAYPSFVSVFFYFWSIPVYWVCVFASLHVTSIRLYSLMSCLVIFGGFKSNIVKKDQE